MLFNYTSDRILTEINKFKSKVVIFDYNILSGDGELAYPPNSTLQLLSSLSNKMSVVVFSHLMSSEMDSIFPDPNVILYSEYGGFKRLYGKWIDIVADGKSNTERLESLLKKKQDLLEDPRIINKKCSSILSYNKRTSDIKNLNSVIKSLSKSISWTDLEMVLRSNEIELKYKVFNKGIPIQEFTKKDLLILVTKETNVSYSGNVFLSEVPNVMEYFSTIDNKIK